MSTVLSTEPVSTTIISSTSSVILSRQRAMCISSFLTIMQRLIVGILIPHSCSVCKFGRKHKFVCEKSAAYGFFTLTYILPLRSNTNPDEAIALPCFWLPFFYNDISRYTTEHGRESRIDALHLFRLQVRTLTCAGCLFKHRSV